MFLLRNTMRSARAQTLVEMTLIIPLLIALGLATIEVGNIINAYLVLTKLTREAANLNSREPGIKGTPKWANEINGNLDTVINSASPVISTGGAGPNQWKVYYSMIVWNPELGPCGGGPIANGDPDRYRIMRSNPPEWTGSVTWEYGSLAQTSKVGDHGACAADELPEVKELSTQGLTLHMVEVFYDYAPSKLTLAENFIGNFIPGIFYRRTVFPDITGE